MQIVSLTFLIFFFITAAGYYLLPAKVRAVWLFAASYVFYLSQGPVHTVFLLFSTLTTWYGGLLLEKHTQKAGKKRLILAVILAVNLLILLWFKYIGLFSGGRIVSPILPIGLSFYLLQACGYLIDVYGGKQPAERNLIRYALFVSFFPTVLSGPIERGSHMLPQFQTAFLQDVRFDENRIRDGLVRMLYGYFCKMVLADHLAIAVDHVYASTSSYGGAVLFLTSVLYSLQIYLDFSGYSSIAVGVAKVLGIEVMENFDAPYLAKSIGEFWRRWHISLSSWLKDYLYIPLGGNRKGTARKIVNLLIVFLVSGLWHGAAWTFLLWGLLHGLYQALGVLLQPLFAGLQTSGSDHTEAILTDRNSSAQSRTGSPEHRSGADTEAILTDRNSSAGSRTGLRFASVGAERTSTGRPAPPEHRSGADKESFGVVLLKTVFTFVLVDLAWILFRLPTFAAVIDVFAGFTHPFFGQLTDGTLLLIGLNAAQWRVVCIGLLLVFVTDLLHTRGIRVSAWLSARPLPLRWFVYIAGIVVVVVCGIWGAGYDASSFIYYRF